MYKWALRFCFLYTIIISILCSLISDIFIFPNNFRRSNAFFEENTVLFSEICQIWAVIKNPIKFEEDTNFRSRDESLKSISIKVSLHFLQKLVACSVFHMYQW